VKRGNPHLLQPQAWSPTLLAEARVEGISPVKRAGRSFSRPEIDGRLKQDLAYSPPGTFSKFKAAHLKHFQVLDPSFDLSFCRL
jgi:hypothetical protein